MKKARLKIIIYFSWLFSTSSFANITNEDETMQLVYGSERMVSIATGNEQLLYKAPAIASVITQQDIENSSAKNLNELLEMVPGLHVSEDYFSGDAVYSMRGFFRDPDAGMVFMINGTTVNTLKNGSRFSAFQMPLNNIQQIEIIRGPGSAVYGADAFVGAINIITRKQNSNPNNNQEFGVQAGSFSNQSAWLQNNFQLGNWQSHISLQYQSTGDDKSRQIENDLQSFLDNQSATNATLTPATLNASYNVLDMELNFFNNYWNINQWLWINKNQANGHGIPALDNIDPNGQLDSQASLSSIEYENNEIASHWSLKVRLSYLNYTTDREQYLLPAGSIAPIGDDGNIFTRGVRSVNFSTGMININNSREQQSHFDITNFYYGWQDHSVRFSSGYQIQKYSADEARNFGPGVLDSGQTSALPQPTNINNPNDLSLPNGQREIFYFSLQDEWNFNPDWALTSGVRYDDYSDFGDTINPRIALVWQTSYVLSTKLLYGRAFRAPVYKELNLQNQLGFNGNSNLQPETIDTLELALDYRPSEKLRSNLGFFAYRAKDLIFAIEDTQTLNTFTYQNRGTQEGYGIEAEANWQLADSVNLSANYTYQYSEIVEASSEAPYAPKHQLYTRMIWKMSHFWSLSPELYFIGSRPRALNETRAPVTDNTRLDLMLKYQNYYKNWDASLRIRNLLDSDLKEPSIGNNSIAGGAALVNDIPLQGIRIIAEFRYFIPD